MLTMVLTNGEEREENQNLGSFDFCFNLWSLYFNGPITTHLIPLGNNWDHNIITPSRKQKILKF